MNYRIYIFWVCAVIMGVFTPGISAYATCDTSQIRTTYFGERGPHVTSLQNCLIEKRYSLPAGATGYFGVQTQAAVKQFYTDTLRISDWDGLSFGPQGKSALDIGEVSTLNGVVNRNNPLIGYRRVTSDEEVRAFVKDADNYGIRPTSFNGQYSHTYFSSSTSDILEDIIKEVRVDKGSLAKIENGVLYVPYEVISKGLRSKDGGLISFSLDPLKRMDKIAYPAEGNVTLFYNEDTHILIVASRSTLHGYDASQPNDLKLLWDVDRGDKYGKFNFVQLVDGTLYVVTSKSLFLHDTDICPYVLIKVNGRVFSVLCEDILISNDSNDGAVLTNVLALDSTNGAVIRSTSFLGGGRDEYSASDIYIIGRDMYLIDDISFSSNTLVKDVYTHQLNDILHRDTISRIQTIDGLDISIDSKLSEMKSVVKQDIADLSLDIQRRINVQIYNRIDTTIEKNLRKLEGARITRLPLDTLVIASSALLPGEIKGQSRMYEYAGNIHVFTATANENDVYVLKPDLSLVGSMLNFGTERRILDAHIFEGRGYLGTRATRNGFDRSGDHGAISVLDFSVPTNPTLVGEIEMDQDASANDDYTNYELSNIRPLGTDYLLSVSVDSESEVHTESTKIMFLDVRDVQNYVTLDHLSYLEEGLDQETLARLFKVDFERSVFFMPANDGDGGIVCSFKDGKLEQKLILDDGAIVREAFFVDDTFYVIQGGTVTSYDMTTWKKMRVLSL